MIEWMRAWNADPAHKRKVEFVGFDMQTTTVAHASVAAYLARVDDAAATALFAPVAVLGEAESFERLRALTAEGRAQLAEALAAAGERFDARKKAWIRRTSKAAFAEARHDLTILEQAVHMHIAHARDPGARYPTDYDARDAAMAANTEWLLAQHGKQARMVVWAHNGHVSPATAFFTTMGSHLRAHLGARAYLVLGFVFAQGSFQAIDGSDDKRGLIEHTVGPAPESDVSAPFTRSGHPLLLADLREAPAGVVADWFAAPHPMREIGSHYFDEASLSSAHTLADRFDGVFFVEQTTRARPNPGGVRPGGAKK